MKKSKLWTVVCIILVVACLASCMTTLFACNNKDANKKNGLVVGYSQFEEKFSPFFATNAYDLDVVTMTQVTLLASDRNANIIMNGIEGETIKYNGTDYTYKGISNIKITKNNDGTVDYTITIRDDIKFSDGKPLTVKDVIFNMYVYSDKDYDGSTTFFSLPIEGMKEWRTNVSTDILKECEAIANAIIASYSADDADYIYDSESQAYTKDQFDALTAKLNATYKPLAAEIVDYVASEYAADYGKEGNPYTPTNGINIEVEGQKIAFGMAMWGFGEFDGDKFIDANGNEYNMTDKFPTIDDYAACIKEAYGSDAVTANGKEKANTNFADKAIDDWIAEEGQVQMNGQIIKSITGITFDESKNTINVKTTEFSATTIYQLALQIAPMHYYGDVSKWDPANGSYGFTRENLDSIREHTTKPVGAGPYKYVSYKDKIVTFEANENYWEGTPKIKNVMFKSLNDDDMLPAVLKGDIDIANPPLSDDVVNQIKRANGGSDKLAIDASLKIATDLVDNNGYGYIGMNANRVKVGSDKASEASKNLRKGFATLFAAYRDFTVNSYYHERASVIQYPITNCSWAAPQPADDGYEIAFSKDVEGNPIYTANMTEEERFAAAKTAFIGFLKAAGYTWDDATGKFTAAPEGAAMKYEVIVAGDGSGNHPNFALLTKCKEVMATVGIEFAITDDNDNLFKRAQGGTVDMFTMAWGGSADPDMYQVYHSDNKTQSNHYRIADATLDELIINARTSDDTTYRKGVYKQCFDIILDWAVEVPVYQRKNAYVFNSDAVNVNTITPDTTPYWTYLAEIYNLELK